MRVDPIAHGKAARPRGARVAVTMAACTAAVASSCAWAFTTFPAQPRAGQDFLLHFDGSLDCGISDITHAGVATVAGSTITITYPTGTICGLIPPSSFTYVNAAVSGLGAGTYTVIEKSSSSGQTRNAGTVTIVAASPVARTSTSLAGLWYVPDAPGWGINIAEGQSGQLFVTWFTYASGSETAVIGASAWLFTSGGQWITPTQFTGIQSSSGGTPFTRPFDLAWFRQAPIGFTSITLTGTDTLTITVTTVDGNGQSTRTFNLTRYKF